MLKIHIESLCGIITTTTTAFGESMHEFVEQRTASKKSGRDGGQRQQFAQNESARSDHFQEINPQHHSSSTCNCTKCLRIYQKVSTRCNHTKRGLATQGSRTRTCMFCNRHTMKMPRSRVQYISTVWAAPSQHTQQLIANPCMRLWDGGLSPESRVEMGLRYGGSLQTNLPPLPVYNCESYKNFLA